MDKEDVCSVCVYTHTYIYTNMYTMEYCSALKKEGNSDLYHNMDGPGRFMLSEISHLQRDKH